MQERTDQPTTADPADGRNAAETGTTRTSDATNAGTRREKTRTPLISGEPLRIGTYELTFHIGVYFAGLKHTQLADPPFLDVVPIRFSIAEPEGHYHVPLLATPWSYTTYRGS